MRWRLFSISFALIAACGPSPDNDANRSLAGDSAATPVETPSPDTWFAATAGVPGGDVRFSMLFRGPAESPEIYLVNGAERVRIRDVSIEGANYTLRLPAFNSAITAGREHNEFRGDLTLIKRGGVVQTMPFRAVPFDNVAPARPPSGINVTGRWGVVFVDNGGDSSRAVGEFVQRGDSLVGTFLTPTGDYRYLAGSVSGNRFSLSCFDGAHAFLFTASVTRADSIIGEFWSGTAWHERWFAARDAAAGLPDPEALVTLRDDVEGFPFAFPDVDGRVVSNTDDRFRGKVTVITLAGSWCPNCHDEAAFLARLYDRLHDSGLEAVGLMYEHYRGFERAARQVRRFAGKHRIRYPLLVAGYSDKNEAAETLPALDRIVAYPTIIVVDKKGAVRRVHTGFSGPGTGAHYAEFTREFTSFVGKLLAE